VSTLAVYEHSSMALASEYFHWFFLIQPRPLPERLIGADPRFWLNSVFRKLAATSGPFGHALIDEYLRTFGTPEGIHAVCEDYRAGATHDLANDRADVAAGRRIACPTLILWGSRSVVGANFRPLEVWNDLVEAPTGGAIECGHFIPEEAPQQTLKALADFFSDADATPRG
jgi:haloacetate dehalogenase